MNNITNLILNTKNVEMGSLVWQDAILTEDDKKYYQEKGYSAEFTKAEFEEKFDIPAECVCYTPSFSNRALYFNRKTLAANQFPMFLYIKPTTSAKYLDIDSFYTAFKEREQEVKCGKFINSILSLPDSLRIEYFGLLMDKMANVDVEIDDLYGLFEEVYAMSDYGFSSLSPATFNKIAEAKTDKQKKRTAENLKDFPDVITIYRGQTEGISSPEDRAYSWTTNISVANFFAIRFGIEESEIVIATIPKNKIIECLDDRSEAEVWIDYRDIEITDRLPVYGEEYLKEQLPKVSKEYLYYKVILDAIPFKQKNPKHDRLHTLRVLLWTLLLSEEIGLNKYDRDILATAALFHDSGRTSDGVDDTHGYKSMCIYEKERRTVNPSVSFLIQYHCLPDEVGYEEIENNPVLSCEADRNRTLYKVFKDSDGLDRVRLSLKNIDINQLRLPISKHLVKVARIMLEHVKD